MRGFLALHLVSIISQGDAAFAAARAPMFGRAAPMQSVPMERTAVKENNKHSWFPEHVVIPTVSYTGLAAASIGAFKLMSITLASPTWLPAGILAYCVGAPMAILASQMHLLGGSGIAKAMGGEPADAYVVRLAREAASAVGVDPPQYVYEIQAKEPNAFAASGLGGRKGTTVAVTSGLRSLLNRDELAAVLAHEMGHLAHKDVAKNMHVAMAIAGLGGIFETGRMLLRASSSKRSKGSSRNKKDSSSSNGAVALGIGLMGAGMGSQAIAHLIKLASSRGAEFRADLAAARAFGADSMMSALRKIEKRAKSLPKDLRDGGSTGKLMAFTMLSDQPSSGSTQLSTKASPAGLFARMGRLLRTHPPIEERIKALEAASALETVPARTSFGAWWRLLDASFYA